jgi:sugar O-acyltransferase (sialic acid O-acetyltransferase NeuD family)
VTEIVIVGAGGHGRELLDIVEAHPDWELRGFVADPAPDPELLARRGAAYLGSVADIPRDVPYTIGIGDGDVRRRIDAELTALELQAAVLIHPAATLGADNRLAPGTQIAAGGRVTTNVALGRHVQINVNAVVSHDCRVGDYCTLSPGVHLNGAVTLGDGVFMGAGAIAIPDVSIGEGAVIGAGAVVIDDVPPGVTAVGVPARW